MTDDIATRLRNCHDEMIKHRILGTLEEAAEEIEFLLENIEVGNKLYKLVKSNYPCSCRREWVCHKCNLLKEWENFQS